MGSQVAEKSVYFAKTHHVTNLQHHFFSHKEWWTDLTAHTNTNFVKHMCNFETFQFHNQTNYMAISAVQVTSSTKVRHLHLYLGWSKKKTAQVMNKYYTCNYGYTSLVLNQ